MRVNAGSRARGRRPSRQGARGTTLIEVMIAIVLLAFGLLGMLELKAVGLKYTGQSDARAAAAYHAAEMFDRLRANPVRAAAGAYNLALTDPAPAAPNGVAQIDLAQWRRDIAGNLPSGTGSVAVQADGTTRVVVQWGERTSQDTHPRVLSFSFDGRL